MWIASWNELCDKKYNKSSDKLYCNNIGSYGYYVGTNLSSSDCSVNVSKKDGYNNSLYYPHHEMVSDGDKKCYYYWLASPSAYGGNYVLHVRYDGYVNYSTYDYAYVGLRPVVSLNSEIKVNATDAE